MAQVRWSLGRLARGLAVTLTGVALLMLALQPMTAAWRRFFEAFVPLLDLPGGVGTRPVSIANVLHFEIPFPNATAPWPDAGMWLVAAGVVVALLVLSLVLPERLTPLAYFLRALALIVAATMGWFRLAGPPFPYPLDRYLAGLLGGGMVMLCLVPVVLALTFYLFEVAWWRKALLTLLAAGHLAVLLPMQALVHAWLIHRFSVLLQPVLFLVFGLLVEVIVLVGLYSWGMSWPSRGEAGKAGA